MAGPALWSVEETDACFIVEDRTGQPLAYVCLKDVPGRHLAAHTRRALADAERRIKLLAERSTPYVEARERIKMRTTTALLASTITF